MEAANKSSLPGIRNLKLGQSSQFATFSRFLVSERLNYFCFGALGGQPILTALTGATRLILWREMAPEKTAHRFAT